jgi:glycosyltransferase involved in cell wall biosynthesis
MTFLSEMRADPQIIVSGTRGAEVQASARATVSSAGSGQTLRLCVMTTIGASIQVLYAGRLEYLANNGFQITVACASSELDQSIRARGVRLKTFDFTRAITPWKDLRALLQLYRFLRTERFDLVEVSTPKAALIGSLAAWLARCPHVIHFLQGLPYEGKRGLLGVLLRMTTAIPCRLATATFVLSPSLLERARADGLGKPDRIRIVGAGGGNGVDVVRFSPEQVLFGGTTRETLRIREDAVVVGFVGRLTRDKGVEELAQSFAMIHGQFPDTFLLVVGEYEARDRPSVETIRLLSTHPGVRHVGWQADVLPFMAAMNVVALPTYREGLGYVLLEAAAMGLPTVTTNATGARDANVDGETGFQVPVGDSVALTEALLKLIRDPSLRKRMGEAGRQWVSQRFDQREVWRRQADTYRALTSQEHHTWDCSSTR